MGPEMTRSTWPGRLRGRLTLLFLLLPTLAIGMVTAYAAISYRHARRAALLEEARTILSLLVQHHPAAMSGSVDGKARIEKWVERIAELPRRHARITYVVLRDALGRDISGGILSGASNTAVGPGAGFVTPNLIGLNSTTPVAHASARIKELDDAFVQIGLRMAPGWSSLAHLHDVLGILAVTLLLNIWMIRTGLRRLIAPLEELAETSRTLADGEEAQPVSVSGPEEVAKLGEAFNRMLVRREDDAARIRNTLHDLEAERAKLSDANRSLVEFAESLREQHSAASFERQRFLAMVECLHEGLIYLGAEGRVEYANPEAARLFQFELSDLVGRRVPTEFITQDGQPPDRILERLVGVESWNATRERYELDLASVAIRGDDESMRGRMILLRDRSQERRLQRQLAEQEKIATVGMLAAGIAHEINNPLDGLQNCLRRIVKDPTNTQQIERYAGLMTASLCHIETVVRQLLNLSHKRDRVLRKVDINDILASAIELAKAGQRWNGVDVHMQLSEGIPLVLADSQNMTQVILNLILNAVDAMPAGGTLTIATRPEPTRANERDDVNVVVEISDTGCGIPADTLPRVFEPFFTTKGQEKGTGLGLSVSRNLVIEHGGEIEVESTPGVGTKFRIVLPRFFPVRGSEVQHQGSLKDESACGCRR